MKPGKYDYAQPRQPADVLHLLGEAVPVAGAHTIDWAPCAVLTQLYGGPHPLLRGPPLSCMGGASQVNGGPQSVVWGAPVRCMGALSQVNGGRQNPQSVVWGLAESECGPYIGGTVL